MQPLPWSTSSHNKLKHLQAEQTSSLQQESDHYSVDDDSSFSPAYVETLPDGLIADEI